MLLTGTDGRKTLINLAHLAVARVESTTAPDVFAVVLYSRDRKTLASILAGTRAEAEELLSSIADYVSGGRSIPAHPSVEG